MDFARQRIRDCARSFTCSNEQSVPDKEILAHRHVKERLRRLDLRFDLHVFRDTDDLHPIVFNLEPLADRIFCRPIFRRHCFVDDRDARRILVVVLGEFATGDKRDLKRREIILADLKIVRVRLLIGRGLIAIDLDRRRRRRVVAERRHPR